MDSKKGIRIKTKETSLVDNIVNFFKPNDPKASPNPEPIQESHQSKDASPRSTTPRKKIFDKTPEKTNKSIISNPNNKSMDHAYEITFNQQPNEIKQPQPRSQLSPPKRFSKPNSFQDTQFNKLILGNSNVSIKKPSIPQKTFLNDSPSNHQMAPMIPTKQIQGPKAPFHRVDAGINRQGEKQLEHHKKLLKECMAENEMLKRENQGLREEVESLRRIIKSYELSSLSQNGVPIISLQSENISSPLQKVSPFSNQEMSPIHKSERSFEQNQMKRQQMKQSIPIMPEIPNEFNDKGKLPKVGQNSFLSSDLKNRSHDGSFMQSEKSFENMPGFSAHNKNQNDRMLSPLQKTVYDRTMKPQERERKPTPQEEKEQISFSKTIGYIKGDQPVMNKKMQGVSIVSNNNPFQEIATESNKFLFQNSNQSVSNNSFRVQEKSNRVLNSEWARFTEGQSSLGYSSNSNSMNSFNKQLGVPQNFSKQPIGESSNHQLMNRSKDNKMQSPRNQNSVTEKTKIEASKTYKFQDFDANDEDSSYVDYF